MVYYYDATALGSNNAVNEQDFRWVVVHEFERHGWTVEAVYLGNPMRHDEKYLLINQGFAGKQRLMPFFNRQNNDDLILAIQAAGVSRGRNGFRKDKGGEKLAESEEDLLEHRTDGTDAFDTLYIGAENFRIATRFLSMFRALFDLFLYLLGDALKLFCPRKRCATGSSLRTFEKIIPPPGYRYALSLTLGIVQTSLTLLSLNRSSRKRSHGLRHTASIPIARQKICLFNIK